MNKIAQPKTGVIEREKERQAAHKAAGTPDPARESSRKILASLKPPRAER